MLDVTRQEEGFTLNMTLVQYNVYFLNCFLCQKHPLGDGLNSVLFINLHKHSFCCCFFPGAYNKKQLIIKSNFFVFFVVVN